MHSPGLPGLHNKTRQKTTGLILFFPVHAIWITSLERKVISEVEQVLMKTMKNSIFFFPLE